MVEDRTLLFRVEDQGVGVRLDLLSPRLLPELSRSRVQKLIGTGLVTVNDLPAPKRYVARARDLLRITLPPPEQASHHAEDLPLAVLFEDEDFLVVDKAPGMVVHPAPGHPRGTLVNALLHRAGSLSEAGGAGRPGIVHRLDKDTSGLVLVAKHDRAHRHLAAQFSRRSVEKTYLAVAAGRFSKEGGVMESALGRDRRERKKISSRTARPRRAVTRWRLLRRLEGAGLLELSPETGRTHQIRVHLAEGGHPVLGDPIYGPRPRRGSTYRQVSLALGFEQRLALHAWKLSFRHPSGGDAVHFTAPLPPQFRSLMPC